MLLLVSLVPIGGFAAFTWNELERSRVATADATRTKDLAARATALAELNSAVFEEMVWRSVDSTQGAFGADPEALEESIGANAEDAFAATVPLVDELAARAEVREISGPLDLARETGVDPRGVLERYGRIIDILEPLLEQAIDDLEDSAVGSSVGDELVREAEVLRSAVEVRTILASEYYGYFASIFDLRDDLEAEVTGLIDLRRRWEIARDTLAENAASSSVVTAALADLDASASRARLFDDIDSLIERSFAEELPEFAPALSLEGLLANLDTLTNAMTSWVDSSGATTALVQGATIGVSQAADAVGIAADEEVRSSYGLAATVIAASLIVAVIATTFIVRPLRGLRFLAERLESEERLHDLPRIGGPTEVRAASRALGDAASHMDLVTRQARALADGSLDAEVFDESAPGGLGTALQSAVGTLRSALAKQDEFRRRLAHEAAHDGMTKLANRNASLAQLNQSLARTARADTKLAVLFIDLDRFKEVNDLHGHQAGDTVLRVASRRIVASVREGDHVGRLGGDEFVVIAEPVSGVEEAVSVAQRVIDQIGAPFELEHGPVNIGASIGIAVAQGDELSADELLRDADLAVYRAKETGTGQIEICNEDLRKDLAHVADMTAAIRHAIDHDELVMHYQPIVDTETENVRAMEALVRWQRPGFDNLIPPDEFIGFAERSALIIEIDRWVINAVARQVATWKHDDRYTGIPVGINVSGRHLANENFVRNFLDPLDLHGIDPSGIIVEVTESALLDDLAGAATRLQKLRDAGVKVSIDDFGTGYTSLAHLRSLPIDIVKIDRTYVANAANSDHEASIVKLIIDTGHLLGVTITAEGVETLDEATLLADLGSDTMQGFYFARPAAPERAPHNAHPAGL